MGINGKIFFEGRQHDGTTSYVLYQHDDINSKRKRMDFTTKESFLDYLRKFNLEKFTPEQVLEQLSGPTQKGTNPPGRKFIFTALEAKAAGA